MPSHQEQLVLRCQCHGLQLRAWIVKLRGLIISNLIKPEGTPKAPLGEETQLVGAQETLHKLVLFLGQTWKVLQHGPRSPSLLSMPPFALAFLPPPSRAGSSALSHDPRKLPAFLYIEPEQDLWGPHG